jgi:hypothetical protein
MTDNFDVLGGERDCSRHEQLIFLCLILLSRCVLRVPRLQAENEVQSSRSHLSYAFHIHTSQKAPTVGTFFPRTPLLRRLETLLGLLEVDDVPDGLEILSNPSR